MKKRVKVFIIIVLVGVILSTVAGMLFLNQMVGANQISFDKNILLTQTAKISIYDNNDALIETTSTKSPVVYLNELPPYVKNAFLSIEDKNFYEHKGLNYKRIIKAAFTNLTSGRAKEGASTISQQLIKNTYLNSNKTLDRKIKEIILTLKLEKEFSKDDILESYLNVIYFGNSSYGIESASENYFNKSAKELTLSEAATLAGLIKSPRTYSPIFNLQNSINRRNVVLNEMKKDGYISFLECEQAKEEPIILSNNSEISSNKKRIYEKAALEEVSAKLNLSEKDVATSNLKIFTYMDKDLQEECENLVLTKEYYHKNEFGNIADSGVVVIDNSTGGISAFYGKSNYNLVTMKRLPGSAIKPILVYAPALEYGKISPTTPILDEKISIAGYEPQNVGGKFYGWVTARNTVEKSLNIPAIKILQYVGIEKAKSFSEKAGISYHPNDTGYSIALGGFTKGISLINLTNSYIPFANGGYYTPAQFIKRIETSNGRVLYENKPKKEHIMSEETAYLMTDMLISGVKYGTSHKLSTLNFEVAGKTGTVGLQNSNKNSDAWSIGYTSKNTVGVWFGNSTGEQEMHLESTNNGGTYASMLLRDILKSTHKNDKPSFSVPDNVMFLNIDQIALEDEHTVKLAGKNVPQMYQTKEVFNKKYAPKQVSNNFENLKRPSLNLEVKDNKVVLSFNASSYLTYELYKVEEDKTELLQTVSNKKDEVIIVDENLEEDVMYEYYLIAKQINYATDFEVTSAKSDSVKAFVNTKQKSEIMEQVKEIKKKKRFILF